LLAQQRRAAGLASKVFRHDTFGLLLVGSLVYEVKLQIMEDLAGCIFSATVQFKNDDAMLCRVASVF
jgi:hypothetical protein